VLPASARLRRRDDFTQTVRGGHRAGRGGLVVHLAVPAGAGARGDPAPAGQGASVPAKSRAGFIVSRNVGNAVTRNLVVRRLRHLVRTRLDALPPGSRLVVRALPSAATRSSDVLGRDLDDALRRLLARTGERST
jgi:ribonuclease P protein component